MKAVDIFEAKSASPMLIAEQKEPFDSPGYLYELKLDGERCLAYLDTNGTVLQNKRKLILNPRYPELTGIHKAVKRRCILDGELAILKNGKPAFSEVQRRSLLSNPFRINLASKKFPACFTAFDILYVGDRQITDLPLLKRKNLLDKLVSENEQLAVSRYIVGRGTAFYDLTVKQDLEGIVAKRRDSLYVMGKRTKDWIKIKNLKDEDFVVCGYLEKGNNVVSVVLGQYREDSLICKGHVTLGVSRESFQRIAAQKKLPAPPFSVSKDDKHAVWLEPELVCTVKYMEKTKAGSLRQPVFKGLREDKRAEECIEL